MFNIKKKLTIKPSSKNLFFSNQRIYINILNISKKVIDASYDYFPQTEQAIFFVKHLSNSNK